MRREGAFPSFAKQKYDLFCNSLALAHNKIENSQLIVAYATIFTLFLNAFVARFVRVFLA